MRVTSNGQVTIPIGIRQKAGLLPNTEIDVDFDGEYVRIRRARRKKRTIGVARLIDQMRRHGGDVPMTTDEIMALMRGK